MAKKTKKAKAAKAKTKKKKAKKTTGADLTRWRTDARVIVILGECKVKVLAGLSGKTLDPAAETALEDFFGPKIKKRKDSPPRLDDWDKADPSGIGLVKDKPLLVADHLGQICAILSKGNVVTKKVAKVAAAAVQKDENCVTALGAGDWCA